MKYGDSLANASTAELLETLAYLTQLIPPDADPTHRERLAEIRRRVLETGGHHQIVCEVPARDEFRRQGMPIGSAGEKL